MEIKKRFDLRIMLTVAYFVAFGVYLAVGLSPVEATKYEISTRFSVPKIDLTSDVTTLKLHNMQLDTPEEIVGSFARNSSNTLLVGHASTVFYNLDLVTVGDEIAYGGDVYVVREMEVVPKDDVDMDELLSAKDRKTLTVMTCAGEELLDGDTVNRLILTATL